VILSLTWTSLAQAMREDGYVSYDRYLSRDYGRWLVLECEECNNTLNDDGWCEYCMEDEDE